MRNKLLLLVLLVFGVSFGQEKAMVEKSIFGIQTGFLGIWGHNEFRLANQISLRSEIGLDVGLSINDNSSKFALIPSLKVEPRWYYNLENRVSKNKSIKKNSGNFVAINVLYSPDWFYFSSEKNINVIKTLSIIPKWGIKRTIGNHFTYETGIGIGRVITLEKNYNPDTNVALDLHLRIGYTF